MRLHPEVPLAAFGGLVHLGIANLLGLLGGTGRTKDGGILNGARRHGEALACRWALTVSKSVGPS